MLRDQKNSVIERINIQLTEQLKSQANTDYIFAEAIKRVLIEDANNFDIDLHKVLEDKTGITIGCGCTYCLALKDYRNAKLNWHRTKKMFEKVFDTLIDEDESWYRTRIIFLEKQSKNARILKNKYKKELNL